MRILLFGKNGQLGRRLTEELVDLGQITALDHAACDISDRVQVNKAVKKSTPDVIINAAAYTMVDQAEKELDLCHKVNVEGPRNIALEAAQAKAAMIHYSTDYVFDGTQSEPYREFDAPNPLNAYGRSKLGGEKAISEIDASHIIFRIGWLYSADPTSFLSRMMVQFKDKEEVSVVEDQRGAPTSADFISEMTRRLLQIAGDNPVSFFKNKGGLYHLGCDGDASWFEFAAEILRLMKLRGINVRTENLQGIPAAAYPSPVKRPAFSKLNVDKWQEMFELAPLHWRDDLFRVMEQIE